MGGLVVCLELSLRLEIDAACCAREPLSLRLSVSSAVMLHQGFLGWEGPTARLTSEFWHVSRQRKPDYRINRLSLTVKRPL
jgi:hypothetical protein